MAKILCFIDVRLFVAAIVMFAFSAYGQDLGSSSGLFKGESKKKPATSSSAKKTTSKPKSESSKTSSSGKSSSSKTTAKSSPKKEATKASSAKSSEKKSDRPGDKGTKAKTETATVKTPAPKSTPAVAKTTPPRPAQNGNIVINVGKPTSGNFDELFEQAIDEGNIARDERNYTVAETAYRRAQNLKPRDSRAIYGLGNLFSDQQRWEEAERAYRQAVSMDQNAPEAYIALSFVLTQPVVGSDLSARYEEAERMARKAIELDSSNPVAFDQLGVSLELKGVIDSETENAYRRAIQLDPNFALAYAHLGRLLRRNGRTSESSDAYRTAINFSKDVPTMILVAEVMQSQQRYFESEKLLREALKEDPKNPSGLFLLGKALTTRGNFNEAENVLRRSIEVSPNSFVSYVQLASLLSRRNIFPEAEKTLMKALKVVSQNEKKRLALEFETVGDGFMKLNKVFDAARVYKQAIALDGGRADLAAKLNKIK